MMAETSASPSTNIRQQKENIPLPSLNITVNLTIPELSKLKEVRNFAKAKFCVAFQIFTLPTAHTLSF